MNVGAKKILVTGGAGYIGSHACKALSLAGYEPVTYDNLSRGFAYAVKWGPLEQGDVLDKDRLQSVMKRHRPAAVMHFAALAYVGESVSHPAMYWRNNVQGSLNVVDAMKVCGLSRIIFSSTCSVYGVVPGSPVTESMPTAPVNPYGVTKLAVEQILSDYHTAHGIQSVSLRYFNAAGADINGEIGENHDPETHLIPLILQSLGSHGRPLTVFGVDYPTPDGSCIRDFIHVSDLADAHVSALEYLFQHQDCVRFNLGTGKGYSVLEAIKSAENTTGLKAQVVHGERRAGDPPSLVSDASMAMQVLKWRPRYPTLTEMIKSAWAWRQKQLQ